MASVAAPEFWVALFGMFWMRTDSFASGFELDADLAAMWADAPCVVNVPIWEWGYATMFVAEA